MVLSSGETEPKGWGRAGLVTLVVAVLALAGLGYWYLTREAPAATTPGPSPRATPTPTPAPGAPTGTGVVEVTGADGANVFVDGRVVATGGADLAQRIESEGYEAFRAEPVRE